ncbi:methyl-accepting chemotaxis protein [Bacillus ectoiniformans]|uniref:methyl-accepting chemotaxis protein n=1 Tax=Bacillus ectoiniformans TaxID=1494429 RepID=UPI00195C34AF|nr:methyl-accepting chemotaxis protein [Bacillus ectoiniformans]MBM7649587.1 methyl-accepting chemotaxis protein [Bacillus ectoiniformans]
MKRTLTWHLGVIIVGIIIASLFITSIATYKTAYDKIYDAAGVEAYGCANITTGLLAPEDVEKMLNGDRSVSQKVGSQLNWTTDHKSIFNTQYILDLDGNLLALDKNLQDKGFSPGDSFAVDQKAIDMLLKMKHPTYSEIYEFGGMERLSGYAPIYRDHDSSKEIVAISVIDFDGNIVAERTWDVVKNGILWGIIPMILASIITILLIRRKTKPISDLIEHAKQVADGNLDVPEIKVNAKDEIGDLAATLNTMTANFRDIISTLKATSGQLTKNAYDTSASLDEIKTSMQQVTISIGQVASSIATGTTNAEKSSDILESLATSIHSAKEKADQNVTNSENTMTTAEHGKVKVNEIAVDMNKIKTSAKETEETIQELHASTAQIQNITGTISAIADQTNLLALNASIEAARAGEHGKGFAVVAEEVRKLAEQSSEEVLEVEKLVKHITSSIQQVVNAMRSSSQLVEQGTQTVALTDQALRDISQAVMNTVEEIKAISALINEESESSNHIVALVNQLALSIAQMAATSQEVSSATEETSMAIEDIAHRSTETSKMAEQLNSIVNKFKVSNE